MEIYKKEAYNHKVGRYKTLSSNAGVGAIVTTNAGYFVMPLSVSEWGFIKRLQTRITALLNRNIDEQSLKQEIATQIDVIDDPRFVQFIQTEQNLPNLKFLVEVPTLKLNEYNEPDSTRHPLVLRIQSAGGNAPNNDYFTIPAIHFPQWFWSEKDKSFKPIDQWQNQWRINLGRNTDRFFAPPRDANDMTNRRPYRINGQGNTFPVYRVLNQVPLLLICDRGHISDIPWYKYFCAKIEGRINLQNRDGVDLFNYTCQPCRNDDGEHELQWIESRNNSESWGIIKCKKCGEWVSLEGIMNIRPYCPGHTPWNGPNMRQDGALCTNARGNRNKMRVALATSNSVYYADSFKGLYIPPQYLSNSVVLSANTLTFYEHIENRLFPTWQAKPENANKGVVDFINEKSDDYFIGKARDSRISIDSQNIQEIRNYIQTNLDSYENYRYAEYSLLSNNESINDDDLSFADINMDNFEPSLLPFFKKIQQVETLSITQAQLGFLRGTMPIPHRENGMIIRDSGQKIYSCNEGDVKILPAYRSYGEGIFIEFNREKVDNWVSSNETILNERYGNIQTDMGNDILEEAKQYGIAPFYMLHTFAHIIIKELEFSCGYPSASLQERIYYSDRMCGVLIYTTDGGEGSMGGLVWQGQPELISRIIIKAINRAKNCSSDPLCSLERDQVNLAACFSCCIISETSCEKKNLCLDRLALIGKYGLFNKI